MPALGKATYFFSDPTPYVFSLRHRVWGLIFVPIYNWLARRVGGSEPKEGMQHV